MRADKRAGRAIAHQGVPRHAQHGGQGHQDHQRDAETAGEPHPPVRRAGQDATR